MSDVGEQSLLSSAYMQRGSSSLTGEEYFPPYLSMLSDLLGMAFLLLVPSWVLTEQNWRLVYFFLLVGGWAMVSHFIWRLIQVVKTSFHQTLFLIYSLLAFCIVIYLVVGTVRFLTWPKLQTVTTPCQLSALIKTNHKNRYRLHVANSTEYFELSQEQFENLVAAPPPPKVTPAFVFYACKDKVIDIVYVPHFHFFVRADKVE